MTKAKSRPGSKAKRKSVEKGSFRVKRAYDPPSTSDGLRVLVDRLWPRGLAKAKLKVDCWPRHLAPSTELRRWYHAHREEFAEFRRRYLAELQAQGETIDALREAMRGRTVTLLTAVRQSERSHVTILCEALRSKRRKPRRSLKAAIS
jgi:uncharacterized protein YeaO (DUF488 family)